MPEDFLSAAHYRTPEVASIRTCRNKLRLRKVYEIASELCCFFHHRASWWTSYSALIDRSLDWKPARQRLYRKDGLAELDYARAVSAKTARKHAQRSLRFAMFCLQMNGILCRKSAEAIVLLTLDPRHRTHVQLLPTNKIVDG